MEKNSTKNVGTVLLVITAHMLDAISPGGIVTIRGSVGWFVAGLVLSSVWQNMFILTKWAGIKELTEMLNKKIKGDEKK